MKRAAVSMPRGETNRKTNTGRGDATYFSVLVRYSVTLHTTVMETRRRRSADTKGN